MIHYSKINTSQIFMITDAGVKPEMITEKSSCEIFFHCRENEGFIYLEGGGRNDEFMRIWICIIGMLHLD